MAKKAAKQGAVDWQIYELHRAHGAEMQRLHAEAFNAGLCDSVLEHTPEGESYELNQLIWFSAENLHNWLNPPES